MGVLFDLTRGPKRGGEVEGEGEAGLCKAEA